MSRHRCKPSSRRSRSAPKSAARSASTPARGGGKLRIIGGRWRRRQLIVHDSPGLRPTPDRVRETLFNWLAFEIANARVLDLYAGTGALGLEALSRGAADAVFVEADARVARTLSGNLEALGIDALDIGAKVVSDDTVDFLNGPAAAFDLVFLDPPFRQQRVTPTCLALEQGGWLRDEAWIYVEQESGASMTTPETWTLHREIRAGDSHGRLFHRQASPPGDAC